MSCLVMMGYSNMNLDDLLHTQKQRPTPSPGGDFQSRVWREIRQRKHGQATNSGWLESWLGLLWQPRLAAVAVVLAALVGVGLAAVTLRQPENATAALNLDVFAPNAPHLPQTLLVSARE